MKTKVLWALVALNVLLLVGLIAPLGRSPAHAQAAGAAKVARPGDNLLLITGEVIGGNSAVVYVVDETTNQLNAVTYVQQNAKNNGLMDMGQSIDLDPIYQELANNAVRAGR